MGREEGRSGEGWGTRGGLEKEGGRMLEGAGERRGEEEEEGEG